MAADIPTDGISLRFKSGPVTTFLFVDRSATFTSIGNRLLDALRERYPHGLPETAMLPDTTPLPAAGEGDARVVFGVPRNPRDLSVGWKPLNTDNGETPTSLRLRENSVLAFTIQSGDSIGGTPSFHVEIPTFEEEQLGEEDEEE
ncbi:hypothetical protein Sste5346_002152 [Sporothrix stenoceras]|uniref:Uncharacterized protein n=1 Tax=Sporothrix stenoceras TaxID=5173 RepID=A0ABR3ZKX1_9PEZI